MTINKKYQLPLVIGTRLVIVMQVDHYEGKM